MRRSLRLLAAAIAWAATSVVYVAADTTSADAWVLGSQPFSDAVAAADSVLDAGNCADASRTLTRNRLAAMTLAVTWPEVGFDKTKAPSPMTLSRYDTNSALYSFRTKSTQYPDAFWHPGVGMWQLDSAGLGAPYTAAERINTATASLVAAQTIKNRFCSFGTMVDAWKPWHACSVTIPPDTLTKCRRVYEDIYSRTQDKFRTDTNLSFTNAVSRTGGMVARNCEVQSLGVVPCHYVDPTKAQGNAWWANPDTGASPISAPFYVWKAGGYEHRAWLPDDTGYSVLIHAKRQLGKNARNSVAEGGTSWDSQTAVCDTSTVRGFCLPRPISGYGIVAAVVRGDYTPVDGDFNADGKGDILWYAPGAASDWLWSGTTGGAFASRSISVKGVYRPVEGDFNGDGASDILWYGPGSDKDVLWLGLPTGGFATGAISVAGTYTPISGEFDGDGFHDVLWYGPGTAKDSLWRGRASGTFNATKISVNGTYLPIEGDFDADDDTDILWYGPGDDFDIYWMAKTGGGFTNRATSVSGTYRAPFSVDISRDGRDDIFWYEPGSGADRLWRHNAGGTVSSSPSLPGHYRPALGDFDGALGPDILWYRPGNAYDTLWLAK